MAVRHAVRHIRASEEQFIKDALVYFGWLTDNRPYGAKPVELFLRGPKEPDLVAVEGNQVYISHGGEPDTEEMELGAGLLRIEHVLFVDIVGENEAIALSIASDVQDRLRGLIGGSRYLTPRERGTGEPLFGYVGEFVDVVRDEPNPDLLSWQSVKATLVLDFPGSNT